MYYRKGVIRVVKWKHRVLACLNNWPRDSTFVMVIASSKKGGFIVPYELHSRSRGCVPKISRKLAWFFFFFYFFMWWDSNQKLLSEKYFMLSRIHESYNFKPSHILLRCNKYSYKCSRIRISDKLYWDQVFDTWFCF